jgi:3-mercaptopyruvate sulfurtransferase SseA
VHLADPAEGVHGVEPLVDVTTLARSLAAEPPPVLLDVRWWPGRPPGPDGPPGLAAYRAGHLPGAVFVDLDRDLAAHEVLALAVAGLPAALYVGSWSHWVTDRDRPVATGPEPG